ncbi:serine hydrolase domain-containing protein [Pseudooceanicola sp.]|uniref:serine hydrolase domain-containing protein n=1 Tax=Pseudooceanicola sp. TaxID=1914328 RepID=UPI0035C6EF2C
MRWLVLLLCLTASLVRAEDVEDRARLFEQTYADWMDMADVRAGAIALRYDGRPVATWARGMAPDRPVAIASLSKSITAACVAALVDAGDLTYDTPARDVLDLPDAAPTTIGALLSHATGLRKDYTQGPMAFWRDRPEPRWQEITERALAPDRLTPGAPSYYYSNENYAVLGTVIEAITGQPYDTACRTLVLDPAGVTAEPSDRFGAYLPWGGWALSVGDFAQFLDHVAGPEGVLTDRLSDLPRIPIDGPLSYGMGLLQRDTGEAINVWHFGALCFIDGPNLGSYAVHWQAGWTVTVWYDACATLPDMQALDMALAKVAHGGQ